ncbi:DgyrCDS7017 [Dimorphilus gyrociliatus]|uniref:Sidoreflexin n=1 Tax=Dimorphilus gyrociliatus TaxID=2664684 RepID=A0A7I8VPX3_9ANNE|nr:DgyrCDS7017 [Dimorphilus gyrociliatus]
MEENNNENRINLDAPRWDQSSFSGRAKHFFSITNPLNLFASHDELEKAKELVKLYKSRKEPPGVTADQVWKAKWLYDSAFHPDTGEKMFLPGRMSAQVPFNMAITGFMLTFYKTAPAVIFWQWSNQTFNAVVNYTNSNKSSGENDSEQMKQLGKSYMIATGSATVTALALNQIIHKFPAILARFVPLVAVAAANCLNIPFMRSQELVKGITVFSKDGEKVGESKKAAKSAISQVVFSRIVMSCPSMILSPLLMARLEKGNLLKKYPRLSAPIQIIFVGFLLSFATPLCCAIFPQKSSMTVSKMEGDIKEKAEKMGLTKVYFNKGL